MKLTFSTLTLLFLFASPYLAFPTNPSTANAHTSEGAPKVAVDTNNHGKRTAAGGGVKTVNASNELNTDGHDLNATAADAAKTVHETTPVAKDATAGEMLYFFPVSAPIAEDISAAIDMDTSNLYGTGYNANPKSDANTDVNSANGPAADNAKATATETDHTIRPPMGPMGMGMGMGPMGMGMGMPMMGMGMAPMAMGMGMRPGMMGMGMPMPVMMPGLSPLPGMAMPVPVDPVPAPAPVVPAGTVPPAGGVPAAVRPVNARGWVEVDTEEKFGGGGGRYGKRDATSSEKEGHAPTPDAGFNWVGETEGVNKKYAKRQMGGMAGMGGGYPGTGYGGGYYVYGYPRYGGYAIGYGRGGYGGV